MGKLKEFLECDHDIEPNIVLTELQCEKCCVDINIIWHIEEQQQKINSLTKQNKILIKQNQALMMDDCNKCQYFKDDYRYIIEAMKKEE